ncbi:hypothetical protein L1987_36791 [Smallanthus sonchifolius]|uniref:Uncharacterized protein n=1 Tax=Smallanthus sonchifolius TaxID=185202 RepID=A0ACB9HFT3_9ASTR|nr:hypothetical protein L1987_36791 [Smallanthus sonchifolius]
MSLALLQASNNGCLMWSMDMGQEQQICSYSELMDSFSSQSYKGYQSLVKRSQYINAATVSEHLDIQESNKASTSISVAPIVGSSPNTFTISFGSSPAAINQNQVYGGYKTEYHDHAIKSTEDMNLNELLGSIEMPKRVSSTRRNRRQAQEHILAERKRREKLTQRFISLSALLPEIKKMDKATVLEDASKYIKHLQNQVKELEETSNIIQESTTSRKTSKIHGGHEHDASSFDETNSLPCNTTYIPGIKVRISGSSILVRIYCERNALLALKVLNEMERLHFTVMCNNALPISATTALIIVTAEMSEEFVMTAMDLVKCLQSSLSNFL